MPAPAQTRIFFALWPDPATRAGLARIAAALPLERRARRVPEHNLHLTLHFIGNVALDAADCMRQAARSVGGEGFELAIDGVGHFRRARVGWLGPAAIPAALRRLHADLGRELATCGYVPEARDFSPHITVARKLGQPLAGGGFEPLYWKVDNFALVESRACDSGVRYEVLESYPLQ